jgi:hypothetical protein
MTHFVSSGSDSVTVAVKMVAVDNVWKFSRMFLPYCKTGLTFNINLIFQAFGSEQGKK